MTIPNLHVLSGDLWGGSEAQMALQLQALRAAGIDARAFLFNEGETARNFRAREIPTTVHSEKQGFLSLVRELRSVCRESPPVIITSHGYKELAVAALGAPHNAIIVHTTHGLSESYRGLKALKSKFYHILEAALCALRVAKRVAVTQHIADSIGDGCAVVHCVAEAAPPRELESIGEKRIICVGRLAQVKRFDRAIEWFGALRTPARLEIVGAGPLQEALAEQVSHLPPPKRESIQLSGFRTDASERIALADLLLISSESEGLPTVLLEAFFSGTPVCSVALPGICEVLGRFPEYPSALIEQPSDQQHAVERLTKALNLPRASEATRENVRLYFSPARAARELASLYRELIHRQTTTERTPSEKLFWRILISGALLLAGASAISGHKAAQFPPYIAKSEHELEQTLRWYGEHSPLSLGVSQWREISEERLRALGFLTSPPESGREANIESCQVISRPARGYLRSVNGVYEVFPGRITSLEIQGTHRTTIPVQGVDIEGIEAQVLVRIQYSEKFFQLPADTLPRDGESVTKVTFLKGEYGYYLPIPLSPVHTTAGCSSLTFRQQ